MIIFDPYKSYECTVRLLFHTAELSAQRRNTNDGSQFMLYAGNKQNKKPMKHIINESLNKSVFITTNNKL
jgi:hypothetical protein